MKKALIALLVALSLSALPVLSALASPDPMANIKVWPREYTENPTEEPLVTTTPADMHIFSTTAEHKAYNVWLLLALNNETHYYLESIEITDIVYYNGTPGEGVIYIKDDFAEVAAGQIPPNATWPDPEVTHPPIVDPESYPGCNNDEQYAVGAIKDKLGTTEPVYYSIQYVFYHITTVPTNFTLTVYAPGIAAEDLKVLVLALGRTYEPLTGPFDNHSAYTQGALIIIPELATILLTTASLTAYGTYRIKRRK